MRDMSGLVRTATRQHGLLTNRQLREAGVTRGRQAGLVGSGLLVPVHRGVLRLAGSAPTWEQRLCAAVLTPGAPVVASHRSALRLWGLRTRFDGLEVTVRRPRNRKISDTIVHRSVDLISADVTSVDGIAVTTVARTLCDAGLIFPEHEVQRLVDHAVATSIVSGGELLAVRRRVGEHGRNGVVKLEAAVDGLPALVGEADSGPEVALLRLLVESGLPTPEAQFEVTTNGRRYRLDLAYPDSLLGLEYDGFDAHSGIARFASDRQRQNDLVDVGWTIRRYTHVDLRERPEAVVAGVRRHLSRA